MHRFSLPSQRLRALFVAILIAALMSSYWQGLAHRIAHASRAYGGAAAVLGVAASPPVAAPGAGSAALPAPLDQDAGHSCLAFDAAAVGAALCGAALVIDPPRFAPVLAAWLAFQSYLAPFTPHFSSRAPPRA